MARRPNQPQGYGERLVVVEERLDAMAIEMTEVLQKLDRLLQLGVERAGSIDGVARSVAGLQDAYKGLKDDTEVIRASMQLARILRRLAMWGVPFVGVALWITERSDLIAKLFRRG